MTSLFSHLPSGLLFHSFYLIFSSACSIWVIFLFCVLVVCSLSHYFYCGTSFLPLFISALTLSAFSLMRLSCLVRFPHLFSASMPHCLSFFVWAECVREGWRSAGACVRLAAAALFGCCSRINSVAFQCLDYAACKSYARTVKLGAAGWLRGVHRGAI